MSAKRCEHCGHPDTWGVSQDVLAEVERLREAIRTHREIVTVHNRVPSLADEELWDVLVAPVQQQLVPVTFDEAIPPKKEDT